MCCHHEAKRLFGTWSPFLVAIFAIALRTALAEESDPKPDSVATQTSVPMTILHGTIRNEENGPLVGVRVRIAVPAADMRLVNPTTTHKQYETKSVKNGEYRIEIPGITEPTKISIDAMKPGYRKLSGTLMRGGDSKDLEILPGAVTEASWIIKPAIYFAGVVVDEKGDPISGVEISANANTFNKSGGVERTASQPNGSFELFNYSPEPFQFGAEVTQGTVVFSHPDYLSHKIEDVYSIAEAERKRIRVVLDSGYKISGRVVDAVGNPIPDAIVKIIQTEKNLRKAVLTDMNGQFSLKGLAEGPSELSATAFAIDQKQKQPILVDRDQSDVEIQLARIELPKNLQTETILGMQLADVTKPIADAYDVPLTGGALILDPGRDSKRLEIGDLEKGFSLWMVGNTRIRGVREFVERILTEVGDRDEDFYSIRVVYSFFAVEFEGTNTQYLRLTKDDIAELRRIAEKFAAKKTDE